MSVSLLSVLHEQKPLKDLCTLAIGGPAKFYIEVKTVEALKQAILDAKHLEIPFFILGKGSNCLFDDRGFNGLVIHNKIDFLKKEGNGRYSVGAGYSFAHLGVVTAREGYKGLEFASGIPASVGGAIFMNAGANGQETQDVIVSVDYIDENGTLSTYSIDQLDFSYRFSPFQKMKGAIVSGTFQLATSPEARQKQIEIVKYRQKTQPYSCHSAGCAFRNPPGQPAGKLIQDCGLKGFAVGEAEVSTLHGNFLINKGNASSSDFKALMAHVAEEVKKQTTVELENEIRIVSHEG